MVIIYSVIYYLRLGRIFMGETNYLVKMGDRISLKRKEKQITQEKLAEIVGVSLQTVSNIECGKKAARPENIAKICVALDTTADYVLLGKKSEVDMKDIIKVISVLPEREYRVITDIVDLLQNKIC